MRGLRVLDERISSREKAAHVQMHDDTRRKQRLLYGFCPIK